jgi:charged multivesicular body protein 1
VKELEKQMETMNLAKMTQIMDKFGQQFENLEVQTQYVENTMASATSSQTPQAEVDSLIEMTADAHALDLSTLLPEFQRAEPQSASSTATKAAPAPARQAVKSS